MRKEVNQKQAELQAFEQQRRVEAALASQMPRLQRWQSMKVRYPGSCCFDMCHHSTKVTVQLSLISVISGGRIRSSVDGLQAEALRCLQTSLFRLLSALNAEDCVQSLYCTSIYLGCEGSIV